MKTISETMTAPFSVPEMILLLGVSVAAIMICCVVVVKMYNGADHFIGRRIILGYYAVLAVLLIVFTGCFIRCAISDGWAVHYRDMWVMFDTPDDAVAILQNENYQILNDSVDGIYHIRERVKDP